MPRYFNKLMYIDSMNLIVKESEDNTIKDEIFYYKEIEHKQLCYLFPKISNIEYISNFYSNRSKISMEYIDYPLLSDLFLNKTINLDQWRNIISKLYFLISTAFQAYEFKSQTNELFRKNFYITKNYDRLKSFISQNRDKNNILCNLWNENLTVHGKKVIRIEDTFEKSFPHLLKLCNNKSFNMIHGDLCFSNIFCSVNKNVIKLIDPRGDFGGLKGIYGDCKYDIAKLYHSVDGLYDFVVGNKVDIKISKNNIDLIFNGYDSDYHEKIKMMFDEIFLSDIKQRKEIKLIESWLFLSMLPLHQDNINRQFILALIGLEKLTDFLNNERSMDTNENMYRSRWCNL